MIEGQSRYIKQIDGVKGVQSCLPTSMLNGWINTGKLDADEALIIQNALLAEARFWFPYSYRNGIGRPFHAYFDQFVAYVQQMAAQELIFWKEHPPRVAGNPEYLKETLESGYAMVTDDTAHSFLLPSQKIRESGLVVIDPMKPEEEGILTKAELKATLTIAHYALFVG